MRFTPYSFRRHLRRRFLLGTGLAAAAIIPTAMPALAQEQDQIGSAITPAAPPPAIDPNKETVTIGVGAVYLPDYEGSKHYTVQPAPGAIGSIKGYSFLLAGNQLSVDLVRNHPGQTWDVQAGPIAQLNFNRTSTVKIHDRAVRSLGDLDTAVELGGYVGIGKNGVVVGSYDSLSIGVSYRHDIADVHDSGIWQPSVTYMTPLSTKTALAMFWTADIVERGYARTYYGVSDTQSLATGLKRFDPKGGLKSWTLGVVAQQALMHNLQHGLQLVAGGTYGRMEGDIARSPIIEDRGSRDQWLATLGLAYTF